MRGSWTLDFHHSLVNLSLIFRIMALIMTLFPVSANTTSSHKQNKNLKEFTKNFPAGCFTSVCAQSKNCISHYNSVNKGIIVKKLCKKFVLDITIKSICFWKMCEFLSYCHFAVLSSIWFLSFRNIFFTFFRIPFNGVVLSELKILASNEYPIMHENT